MNRKLKIAAIMVALCCVFSVCQAQRSNTVSFSYDKNGNRTGQIFVPDREWKNPAVVNNDSSTSSFQGLFNEIKANLYPNPTSNVVSLNVLNKPEGQNLLLKLTSSTGLILLEKSLLSGQETIDMTNLSAGVYLVQLISGEKKNVWKVVKQ